MRPRRSVHDGTALVDLVDAPTQRAAPNRCASSSIRSTTCASATNRRNTYCAPTTAGAENPYHDLHPAQRRRRPRAVRMHRQATTTEVRAGRVPRNAAGAPGSTRLRHCRAGPGRRPSLQGHMRQFGAGGASTLRRRWSRYRLARACRRAWGPAMLRAIVGEEVVGAPTWPAGPPTRSSRCWRRQ